MAICIGVTDSPWPIGRLPIEEPEYCQACRTIPCSSPGQVDAGRRAEPEPVHPVVEALRDRACMPISSAPMLLETLRMCGHRQRLVAVGLGVVDLAVGDLEHRGDVELRARA